MDALNQRLQLWPVNALPSHRIARRPSASHTVIFAELAAVGVLLATNTLAFGGDTHTWGNTSLGHCGDNYPRLPHQTVRRRQEPQNLSPSLQSTHRQFA